ncbi:MAG: hypothetical protein DMG95_02230 [Acidobacteria bacterium]|nr:MAG: hypothetical protein DMG94_06570 [Acidobacteriota bacterium]PYV65215.1 MAG: hypothetical protein DMG95_02230 [Acidobacteriota bacterium]
MIDYFNCAADFADHADNFFFPDPKWLKTIPSFLRTLLSSQRKRLKALKVECHYPRHSRRA